MRISVIGAGYVGLTTSVCFAELGHDVVCADIDEERIAQLGRGVLPFREKGLEAMLHANVERGLLHFAGDLAEAVSGREVVMIAVGTPKGADGEVDLTFVRNAAAGIAPLLEPKTVVTLKSTVAVGTARSVREIIAEQRGALDFWVTSNPEFLREGSAVDDFMNPDRIVIGADDHDAAARLIELYRPLLDRGVPLVETATVNAELIKYAANALLALKIGFINDVADLCEKIEGDITSISRGIGLDRRIGPGFLEPGPGYGGSCFPKDTEAFAAIGRRHGAPQALVETLIGGNEVHRRRIAIRALEELAPARGSTVAVLGAAFKADTDDIRESSVLTVVPMLQQAGVLVRIFDPWAKEKVEAALPQAQCCDDMYEAAEGADLLLILTEWEMFRTLKLSHLSRTMRGRVIFDCRNMLDPQEVARRGFRYLGIGRPDLPKRRATRAASARERRAAVSTHL